MQKSSKVFIACTLAVAGAIGIAVQAQTTEATQAPSNQQQQNFVNLLAEAEVAKTYSNLIPGTALYDSQLATTTQQVQDARANGIGWGSIANTMGLNWGKVVSDSKRNVSSTSKKNADSAAESDSKSSASAKSNNSNSSSGGSNGGGNGGGRGK